MNCEKSSFSFIFLLVSTLFFSCSKDATPDDPVFSDITISAIKPTHGPFNTIDTLIGIGFDKIPEIDSVLLNGKKLTLISRSPEQVIVKIPELAGTGHIDIWYKGKVVRGPVFTYDSTLFVTTVAGSSTEAGAKDGKGPDARFNQPQGIVVDKSGNIYVADMNNFSIRKIDTTGLVTTLAGPLSSEAGYINATGEAARFYMPIGITIDNNGFLYVGDYWNARIRKVSPFGAVTTFAGNSYLNPYEGQVDGDISVATFNRPMGLVADAQNNIYVADVNNSRIRKITQNGSVSTLGSSDYYNSGYRDGPIATALFNAPFAMAIDPSNNLYVIDGQMQYIRKISSNGVVSTLFGRIEPTITGSATTFTSSAIATDKNGNLYFAVDFGIMKRTPEGKVIRYAVGGTGELDGPAQIASYRSIAGIAADTFGNLYITDNNRVRKLAWR